MAYYISDISFNFYDELNNDDNTEDNISDSKNSCLISNLPLDGTCITLPCDHKFNYYYLFHEVLNSKKKNISFSSLNVKLNVNQIRCPYCRAVYDNLLPLPLDINGVFRSNSINTPTSFSFKIKCKEEKCNYNEIDTNGNHIYITPLGHYCRKHYNYNKSKNENKELNIHDKEKNNKRTKRIKSNEIINENWMYSNWNSYKIEELKAILKENKLNVSGKKALLISRLIDNNILSN